MHFSQSNDKRWVLVGGDLEAGIVTGILRSKIMPYLG